MTGAGTDDDDLDDPPVAGGDDAATGAGAEGHDAGPGDEEGAGDVAGGTGPVLPGLSWPKALVLAVAVGFLGFALAVFVGQDRPPAGDSVDVGFTQDMISHHEQALEMAQAELLNGSDPTVLGFAREILLFQSKEVGSLERLLAQWDQGRGDPEREAMAWMGMPSPVDRMPGMATEDELDRLRAAEGAEADALFLELMARHHVGGLHMTDHAAGNAGTDEVRDFAAIVGHNQAVEVNELALTAERLGLPVEIEKVEVPADPRG